MHPSMLQSRNCNYVGRHIALVRLFRGNTARDGNDGIFPVSVSIHLALLIEDEKVIEINLSITTYYQAVPRSCCLLERPNAREPSPTKQMLDSLQVVCWFT